MFYGATFKGDVRVSSLASESHAAAWLVEQMVDHLVDHHKMRGDFRTFLQVTESVKAMLDDGEVRCPFCDDWAGSIEVFPYEIPSRMFVVIEEENGQTVTERKFPSLRDALIFASREWEEHRKRKHHEEIYPAPLRSQYTCGVVCAFRVYVKPET